MATIADVLLMTPQEIDDCIRLKLLLEAGLTREELEAWGRWMEKGREEN